ncbi:MAG: 7-carboxy-7-deazaguanine synthase [Cycloclasticus sp. symbiont of Poecilosclerida sp. M]|nr:MAG: 7-carboxy-7-deazaguanine synthase [Cycloclasticus sp. symbiont of Poecilosclerida sp. M]
MSKETLRVTEIFYSLQGEGATVGIPTTFIRLTGCPLRCEYCDTKYAFYGGKTLGIDDIMQQVESLGARYINVTGGEPLSQKRVHLLMKRLCDDNYQVSLETSGAIDVSNVDSRVSKVLDVKTPGSSEDEKNNHDNYSYLTYNDQVKYVICSEHDYNWSKDHLLEHDLNNRCPVLFSPCVGQLEPQQLADWLLSAKLPAAKFPVRFQIQLHKYLWGDTPGK